VTLTLTLVLAPVLPPCELCGRRLSAWCTAHLSQIHPPISTNCHSHYMQYSITSSPQKPSLAARPRPLYYWRRQYEKFPASIFGLKPPAPFQPCCFCTRQISICPTTTSDTQTKTFAHNSIVLLSRPRGDNALDFFDRPSRELR
jgi:hypothetical protein